MSMRRFLAPVSSGPDGQVLANYGRYFRDAVATAFYAAGGQERFNDYADNNYPEFAKTFLTRMIPKEVEVQTGNSVEDLLRQLDSKMVDITPKEVVGADE